MKITIYTDGAARGNPGPAGIGVAVFDEQGAVLDQYCRYLGTATNNIAEYEALVAALSIAAKYIPCAVQINSDSELMVRQMRGEYKVKNEGLLPYYQAAKKALANFERIDFVHVSRENNRLADKLANQGIDQGIVAPGSVAE